MKNAPLTTIHGTLFHRITFIWMTNIDMREFFFFYYVYQKMNEFVRVVSRVVFNFGDELSTVVRNLPASAQVFSHLTGYFI